jgi:hypothetical protein
MIVNLNDYPITVTKVKLSQYLIKCHSSKMNEEVEMYLHMHS